MPRAARKTETESAPPKARRRRTGPIVTPVGELHADIPLQRTLPLLPIRDQVYFPHMIFPLLVGREKSVRALDESIKHERHIVLVAQKHVNTEDPERDELYSVGITAEIMQHLRVPDGTVRVMLEGVERVKILSYLQDSPFYRVVVEPLKTDEY